MNKKLKNLSVAAVVMLFIAGGQTALYAQKAEVATLLQSANRIVGAWETTVTPVNCDTGDPVGPAFHGVITFNEGGTIAEFGANPAVPFRTPGHGIWAYNINGTYSMKFSFLPLTPAGAPVGRMRVSQDLELSRFSDESTSSGSFVLSGLAGNVIATGCSRATAVRITL